MCLSFDDMVGNDCQNASEAFAQLLVDLIQKSLVLTKTFSILPTQFVTERLTSACDDFRMTFVKELVVLT